MKAADIPQAQHVGPRPRGGATINFIGVAAVLLVVGERLVDRDGAPPPPIPSN